MTEVFATADSVRNEYCLKVVGLVRARPEGTNNADLISGGVEVLCHEMEILNKSETPPFHLDDENLSETTRLTYRVLDLRRLQMQKNLKLRYKVTTWSRAAFTTVTSTLCRNLRNCSNNC